MIFVLEYFAIGFVLAFIGHLIKNILPKNEEDDDKNLCIKIFFLWPLVLAVSIIAGIVFGTMSGLPKLSELMTVTFDRIINICTPTNKRN